ncbi:MAG: ABC transporter permease [Acidimicrobiales bacterium]
MLKVTLKGVIAHKIRFLLTSAAVVLGVAFIVAAFAISDGIKDTFNNIAESISSGTDAQVRASTSFDTRDTALFYVDETLVATVQSAAGVEEAVGVLGSPNNSFVPLDAEGIPLKTQGAPILSFSYTDTAVNTSIISEGRGPETPDEFNIDVATAKREKLEVGSKYQVQTPTAELIDVELVGTFIFGGSEDATAGAILMQWELTGMQQRLDAVGSVSTIEIIGDGSLTNDELATSVQAVLPEGVEAVSNEVIVQEARDQFVFTDILTNVFLGFAFISMFVSSFIIYNVFKIVLGQRVRELALLRAVGASGTQVRNSVLAESIFVGGFASAVGIPVGLLLAKGLAGLLNAVGGFPQVGLPLAPRTVIFAVAVGIIVTLLASVSPARRAAKVPPIAAMRDDYVFNVEGDTRRNIIGATLLGLGIASLGFGLLADVTGATTGLLLSIGALGVFLGISMLASFIVAPVVKMLGAGVKALPWLGREAHLANQNAARSPQRTATTASALVIGLALIATVTVVGQSIKATLDGLLDNSIQTEFFITNEVAQTEINSNVATKMDELDDVESVSAFRLTQVQITGNTKDVLVTQLETLDGNFDPDIVSGSLEGLDDPNLILLHEDPAADLNAQVGDDISVLLIDGTSQVVEVAAIYSNAALFTNYVMDADLVNAHSAPGGDLFIGVSLVDGVSEDEGRAALETVKDTNPSIKIQNAEEYKKDVGAQIDQGLLFIFMMLLLTIIIAFFGVAITMSLSVFERTREIGLLRAVGMSKRQTRSMIRWESAVVSAFGALMGTVVGVAFGWVAVTALPEAIVSDFAIPGVRLVLIVVISTLIGLLAGLWPAVRAGKMNVLDAIVFE